MTTPESEVASPTFWHWLLTLLVSIGTTIVGGVWGLRASISKQREELDQSVLELERSINERMDTLERERRQELDEMRDRVDGSTRNVEQSLQSAQRLYDATLAAVKQELHEHVVHVERHFARRDSFHHAVAEMKQMIADGVKRLEAQIEDVRKQRPPA